MVFLERPDQQRHHENTPVITNIAMVQFYASQTPDNGGTLPYFTYSVSQKKVSPTYNAKLI